MRIARKADISWSGQPMSSEAIESIFEIASVERTCGDGLVVIEQNQQEQSKFRKNAIDSRKPAGLI